VLVTNTGGATSHYDSYGMGIEIYGRGCVIRQNVVQDTFGVRTGEGVGISISQYGEACIVRDNFVGNTRQPIGDGRTFGIWSGPSQGELPVFRDNTITTVTYGFGYVGVLKNNLIINATCGPFYGRPHVKHLVDQGTDTITYFNPVDPKAKVEKAECPDRVEHFMARAMRGESAALFRLAQQYVLAEDWPAAAKWYDLDSRFGHLAAAPTANAVRDLFLTAAERQSVRQESDELERSIRASMPERTDNQTGAGSSADK